MQPHINHRHLPFCLEAFKSLLRHISTLLCCEILNHCPSDVSFIKRANFGNYLDRTSDGGKMVSMTTYMKGCSSLLSFLIYPSISNC
ncbi:uncharacterized protein LOC121419392 isoform X2 [Lytechinus variegatus]|uniref:uncharacterized protein LOC121419392 isoform X2 n=1 Tax=Lytechinus variegatus TaxID=7654 RepID=UPI001BB1D61D|nr:uncharacterized protein LOC121419392 isoform X2 [Lytechinus variegatus]